MPGGRRRLRWEGRATRDTVGGSHRWSGGGVVAGAGRDVVGGPSWEGVTVLETLDESDLATLALQGAVGRLGQQLGTLAGQDVALWPDGALLLVLRGLALVAVAYGALESGDSDRALALVGQVSRELDSNILEGG